MGDGTTTLTTCGSADVGSMLVVGCRSLVAGGSPGIASGSTLAAGSTLAGSFATSSGSAPGSDELDRVGISAAGAGCGTEICACG
jgi:hypothetical protein